MRVGLSGLAACLLGTILGAGSVASATDSAQATGSLVATAVTTVGNAPGVGKFLVASRELRDPNFRETVVLLVEHDDRDGAVGLVINRPTPVELFRLIPHVDGIERSEETIFRGGPVGPTTVMLLVRSVEAPEGAKRVFDDVFRSGNEDLLERLAVDRRPDESFRTYAGYAGWAPGQLEAEIAAGGWHVVPASAAAIFDEEPEAVWPRLIQAENAEWASRSSCAPDRRAP